MGDRKSIENKFMLTIKGDQVMPAKVVFLVHRLNIGGVEQRLLDFLKYEMNNKKFSFTVLCLKEKGSIGEEISKLGVRLVVLGKSTFFYKLLQLFIFLKNEKPDIVHFQMWPSRLYTPFVKLFSRSYLIYTIEDQQEYMSKYGELLEKLFSRLTDKIVAVSNSAGMAYCAKIKCNSEKIAMIYNGVDLCKFEQPGNDGLREKLGLSSTSVIVTTVARIVEKKGHIYLVKAAKILKEKYKNLKFLIVGDGNCRSGLLQEIKKLDLEDVFLFLGHRRDINNILNFTDIFVLPSIGDEGQGISVVEAMAAGKAVVTTNIKGINEVANNSNSILVPPKDHIALAKAIEELIGDKKKRNKLGEEARKQVSAKFSLKTMCKSYEKLYLDSYKRKHVCNILFFEPSSGFGGSGNSLFNVLNHIDRDTFNPVIVTYSKGPQFDKIMKLGIEVIRLNSKQAEPETNKGIGSYFKFAFALLFNILPLSLKVISIIRKHKISLIHINTNIISGLPAIIAAKISRIPCICHIRQTRKLIKREKIFANWIDKFIALNKYAKYILKKDIPEGKLNIIYDGVDLDITSKIDKFSFRKEFGLNGEPTVGFIGRLTEGKGLEDFIKAASIVVNKKPNVRFLVVGSSSSKNKLIENRIRKLAELLNLNGSLIFTGWKDDAAEIAVSFDISVQPYTSPEGLPNVIIEAMASAKPVVTTNIPGPTEIVIGGETGLLVPPNNPATLAEAILKLLDNPELARQMGAAGKKRAEDLFDVRKIAKEIERIYERLL